MAEGRKMALIPIEMLDQMKKANLTPLTQPNKDRVVKEMAEMSSLLRDEGLPDSLKASRYSEKLKDYSTFANKLIEPTVQKQQQSSPSVHPQQDMFASLPTTYRAPANVLMRELEKYPHMIQWNPTTHEVSVKGQTLKGSNVVDLISDVMRTRKTAKVPIHGSSFLKTLADLNLPESFVKNKYRISQFRSYKRSADGDKIDDDDNGETSFRRRQVAKARKQLEASGSRRFNGTKRFRTSTHKWYPI